MRRLPTPSAFLQRVGWAAAGHAGTQVIRFAGNLVLTRLLAPELFGIMILLTSLRVGLELFTDVGIGQNIIVNKAGTDERFYNTAWTVQVIRGGLLAVVSLALFPILGAFYDQDQLSQLLPFLSLFFILTGFNSIGPPLAVKALQTKRVAVFEFGAALLGAILLILAAVIAPNIWGLLAGNVLSTLSFTILTYFVRPDARPRFIVDRHHIREIIGLGKWIFVSSIVYFLATNYDRLILAKYVTFAALGLYGLARSLGDVAGQFASKLGGVIIFPGVASSGLEGVELRTKLRSRRRQFLLIALPGIAALVAGSDLIVQILYDPRYEATAHILPWVGLAAWVGILNTLNENVLLGLRRPVYMALGNAAKLAVLLILLPLAVSRFGIIGASAATLLSEIGRYIALAIGKFREDVGFLKQDLAGTVVLLVMIVALRAATHTLGLSPPAGDLMTLHPL